MHLLKEKKKRKKEKKKKAIFVFSFFVCKASDTRQTHVYSFLHAAESESTSFICRVTLYIITSASRVLSIAV